MKPDKWHSFSNLAMMLFLPAVCGPSSAQVAEEPIAWWGKTEIATGRGEKGPWQQNDSRYNYVDDPAVSIGPGGSVVIAYVEQASKDVFLRRLPAKATDSANRANAVKQSEMAINVSRSPETFSWLPRMVRAPDRPKTLYILWQEIIFSGGSHGGDILFASSVDGGRTLSTPLNISDSIGGDGKGRINAKVWHNGSFDIVAGKNGLVAAAWTEYDGQLWFSRSDNYGKSVSRPRRITVGGTEKPVRGPSLALAQDNVIYLAWTTGEDDDARIRIARSSDGGASFSEPILVGTGRGYADAPKLAVGADNVLHLVFAQGEGGPFGRFAIHYSRSIDGSRFDAPREISSPTPNRAESVSFPSIGVDKAGKVHVLYELFPDHRKSPRGLGITTSIDGGSTFMTPRTVPDSADPSGGMNGSQQGLLTKKLDVGPEGEIAIVNSSLKLGAHSRVWMMRGTPAQRQK